MTGINDVRRLLIFLKALSVFLFLTKRALRGYVKYSVKCSGFCFEALLKMGYKKSFFVTVSFVAWLLSFLTPPAVSAEGVKDFTIRMRVLLDLRKVNISDGGAGENQIKFGQSSVALTATFQERVRAVVKANLSHLFKSENSNKIDFNDHFEMGNFIDNAYIEIQDIGDTSLAVLIGKRDLVLGLHDITEVLPLPYTFWENYQMKYDVISMTFKIADTVELTIYEGEDGDVGDEFNEGPGEGDFDIEERSAGVLLRVEQNLGPKAKAVLAYNAQKNEHLGYKKPERKLTLDLKADLTERTGAYAEGMYLFENPPLGKRVGDKGKWGLSTGVFFKLSDKVILAGSYTDIEKLTKEYGLGLFFPVFFGPESFRDQSQFRFQIYHSEYPDLPWHEDTFIGLNLRWIFDTPLF